MLSRQVISDEKLEDLAAESFYQAGRVKNVLIVCAEEPTRMTDWSDRRTCVLFGDGAGFVSGAVICEW